MYRIYCELELNLRIRPRKRLKRTKPETLAVPEVPTTLVDGLHAGSTGGWAKFRTLNVLDDYNREGLGIEVDFSLPAVRVVRSLNQIIEWRGAPQIIRVDNGPEYISGMLKAWAETRAFASNTSSQASRSRTPISSATIARFAHEWLDQTSLKR